MTASEAAEYAPQWGSYMTNGDPGAIMYSVIPPETAEHRDSMVAHIKGTLYPLALEGDDGPDDDSELTEYEYNDSQMLRRLVAYLESLEYAPDEANKLEPDGVLARAYRYHRQRRQHFEGRPPKPLRAQRGHLRYSQPVTAVAALREARGDVQDGMTRYPETQGFPAAGAAGERGGRYVDNLAAAGLRFVGWGDEIGGQGGSRAAVDNRGWFLFPDGEPDEVYRAAVLQLPARNGRPLYVPAYQRGSTGRDGRNWTSEESGFVCFLGEAEPGTESDSDYYPSNRHGDAARDVARSADEEARIAAEKECEYQEAWRAGSVYAALGDDLAAIRTEFRPLYRDHKSLVPGSPTMSAARNYLMILAEQWTEKRAERTRLLRGDSINWGWADSDLRAAFADGAGLDLESL